MAKTYANAVRAGIHAAARVQQQLGLKDRVEGCGGSIDVFGAIHRVELPLLLRPLKGLLGAYLNFPTPGILVTTQRPMSIQRFTAAHELGHFLLRHEPSLDDENILRRMPLPQFGLPREPKPDLQEIEADAFAAEFMMPRWLLLWHCTRQGWVQRDFRRPSVIYQLSLRIGASYEATCWTLVRHNLIQERLARDLLRTPRRTLKEALLEPYQPNNYRGDVWLLTERDAGTRIDGSRNDLFVLRLHEHSDGGFLWDIDQLKASGFVIARDAREAVIDDGIGTPLIRRVTAAPPEPYQGNLRVVERRPWQPDTEITALTVEYDLSGPEAEGLSRAERRSWLESA